MFVTVFSRLNPLIPNMMGFDEVEIMMTSLPVSDEFTFSGIPGPVNVCILFQTKTHI